MAENLKITHLRKYYKNKLKKIQFSSFWVNSDFEFVDSFIYLLFKHSLLFLPYGTCGNPYFNFYKDCTDYNVLYLTLCLKAKPPERFSVGDFFKYKKFLTSF
jgi:hypothetical protein